MHPTPTPSPARCDPEDTRQAERGAAMLTFGSLFAGIGGIDLGLERAGMRCAWQVEKDAAARSVLSRHWPDVPKYADVRDCGAHNLARVDVIGGGFPCQGLSVAGKRGGLADARSGLFYEMTRIADELRPALLVWENVPGLLTSDDGRDFARVLVELDRIGYCGAWTSLDAQFFGLAQRRQRILGVFARRGAGAANCAEILALAARLPWNTPARRKARARVAPTPESGTNRTGGTRPPGTTVDTAESLISFNMHSYAQDASAASVSPTLAADHGVGITLPMAGYSTSGRGYWRGGIGPGVARSHKDAENGVVVCGALSAAHGGPDDNSAQAGHVIAFTERGREGGRNLEWQDDLAYTQLNPGKGGRATERAIAGGFGVRRLTPRECERLQGFPDDWTAGQSDSARYRQLGNAVAVPVAEWIGRRILAVVGAAGG